MPLADETAVVPSFRSESYGVPITFSSPRSREALLDLMVATIQAKDLRKCSTLVICQQNAEARHVKSEMGKRNINTMLLDADHPTMHNMVRLWSQGYIQQVLIACDDHLHLLEGICVNFVIHTALPPMEKFKDRLKMLYKSESKAEMLAFISDGRENGSLKDVPFSVEESVPKDTEFEGWETPPEISTFMLPVDKLEDRFKILTKLTFNSDGPKEKVRGLQSQPEIGNAFDKEQNYKTPLNDNLEKASEKAHALTRVNGSVKADPIPPEESVGEDTEFEGWETPPETLTYMLDVEKVKDRLKILSKLAFNSDDPKDKIQGLQSKPENGNAFDKEKNDKTPLNDNLEKASEKLWSCGALTRVNGSVKDFSLPIEESFPEEPEIEGWKTPPAKFSDLLMIADGTKKEGKDEPKVINLEEVEELHRFGLVLHCLQSRPSSKYSEGRTNGHSSAEASVIASEGEGMTRAQFGVVVWCRDPIVSCYDLSGVPDLNPSIRDTMMALMEDMKDRQTRGLQRYAWPHVASGKSLVAVGPEKVGKTWCFLPSLCQRTHEQMLLRSDGLHGPISIVVALNQQQGNQILQWITQLFNPLNTGDRIPYKQVVTLWEKGNVKEAADTLRHSVGILVTTPDMLLLLKELHTKKKPIFDANSVKCLALDNLSDMMRHLPDITAKMVDWIIKLFDFGVDGCQLFVTTRLWPEILMRESLLHLVPNVLVVFKDPLEATIFWKANLKVNLIEPGEQGSSLVKMLRDRSLNNKRIVVMCQTKQEVLHLKQRLGREGIRAEGVYADGGLSTVNQWRVGKLSVVLLVTDDMVHKVNCGPIDQLIHYSPPHTWMRFKFRFSLLYNNYISSVGCSPGKVVVLLQQSYFDHLWLLSEFIIWHQLPRPDHWLRVLAKSRQLKDIPNLELANLPLCTHISSYGDCFRRTCRYRHVMWKEEAQPAANYPIEGEFCFHVLTCNNPTTIAVRLNELYPTKIFFLNSPMSQLGHEVHMYYEIEQNRLRHVQPKVDEIVIVRNQNRYERAVITSISEKVVTVRLLDSGIDVLTYKRSQIFICEERHQIEPGQAMEVRVIGIEPATLDRIWTKDIREVVRTSFFSRSPEKRSRIFSASVKFVLSRTIFVETVFDDKGQDLRSFLLDRFYVHEDIMTVEKLVGIANASQPRPK